jgi:hypothetical protein
MTAYRDKLNAGHYAPPQQAQAEQPPVEKPKPKAAATKKTGDSG